MKLAIIILTGLLFLVIPLSAQNNSKITELFAQNEISTNSENDLLFICRASLDETNEKKDWQSSVLIDYNDKAHQVKGHYNSDTDEMQILLQNQSRTIFPQKIKAIKIGEMIFVPYEFEGTDALNYGYFQVLSSNKIDLLMKFETQEEYISKTYFTRKDEEIAKPLKLNKSAILKELDNKQTAKFLKEEQLNIKNEEELIKLFNYHNSLN